MNLLVPGVPGRPARVGTAAEREFHRPGLAEDDAPGPFEAADKRALRADDVVDVDIGSRRRRHALDGQQILDAHRNPHEWAEVNPRRERVVDGPGRSQGHLGGHVLEGPQAAVEGLDAGEKRFGGGSGGGRAAAKAPAECRDASRAQGVGQEGVRGTHQPAP